LASCKIQWHQNANIHILKALGKWQQTVEKIYHFCLGGLIFSHFMFYEKCLGTLADRNQVPATLVATYDE